MTLRLVVILLMSFRLSFTVSGEAKGDVGM